MGGILHIVNDLRQSKHPLQEAYRGLIPNIVGNTASWAAYFFWYVLTNCALLGICGED